MRYNSAVIRSILFVYKEGKYTILKAKKISSNLIGMITQFVNLLFIFLHFDEHTFAIW